jgi:hypothetical protein
MDDHAPNIYQLTGPHLSITYSTTSIDGQPHLSYQDAHQTLNFRGEQIRAVSTEIGTLVTVNIRMTVDTGSTSFSVLLPRVSLDNTRQAPVRTEGITTIHRRSPIPAFNHGQLDTYTVVSLSGTARNVVF